MLIVKTLCAETLVFGGGLDGPLSLKVTRTWVFLPELLLMSLAV